MYVIVELCEVEILGKWILNILENGFFFLNEYLYVGKMNMEINNFL